MSREVRGRSLPISAGAAGNSKLVLSLWIRGCVTIFDVVALLDGGTIGCGFCFGCNSANLAVASFLPIGQPYWIQGDYVRIRTWGDRDRV